VDTATTTASSTAPAILIGVPLIAGAVLVLISWSQARVGFGDKLGPPDWDFSASFASTIAGVGAVLGTILGAQVLPANPHYLSTIAYTGLNLFFAVLVVVAPFVFAATRDKISQDAQGLHYEGFVWSFMIASAITVWAVIGELATLGVLFWELHHAGTLSGWAVWPIWVLIAGTISLTAYYSVRTVIWTLKLADAHKTKVAAATAGEAVDIQQAPLAPHWKLL
jgi:hypothetical protein